MLSAATPPWGKTRQDRMAESTSGALLEDNGGTDCQSHNGAPWCPSVVSYGASTESYVPSRRRIRCLEPRMDLASR